MTTPHGQPAPYGTPEAPRIAVRGEARLDVDPEIARIGITVSSRGTERRHALDQLTRRNTAALDLVRSYGDAVEKLETGAFVITPQWNDKGRGERIRAHQGHVRLTATLNDFTALGELTTRLADLELTGVDGPVWALRPDSPAHREARTRAVTEAVQRAREYAAALDARLVALLELADSGAENTPPPYPPPPAGARAGYAGAPGGTAAPINLEPRRQTVNAHVNARFTITPPPL